MNANERRAEIMRIMTARRCTTMPELAQEFSVTTRTIRNDIIALTVDYPLETRQGNGGCVYLPDWYHPHRNILSNEQKQTLSQLMESANVVFLITQSAGDHGRILLNIDEESPPKRKPRRAGC